MIDSVTPVPYLFRCTMWQVVGIVSPWIDADSDNAALRRDSAAALRQELQWAAHLSLQACSDSDSAAMTLARCGGKALP